MLSSHHVIPFMDSRPKDFFATRTPKEGPLTLTGIRGAEACAPLPAVVLFAVGGERPPATASSTTSK
jgi:hypothetical protein